MNYTFFHEFCYQYIHCCVFACCEKNVPPYSILVARQYFLAVSMNCLCLSLGEFCPDKLHCLYPLRLCQKRNINFVWCSLLNKRLLTFFLRYLFPVTRRFKFKNSSNRQVFQSSLYSDISSARFEL